VYSAYIIKYNNIYIVVGRDALFFGNFFFDFFYLTGPGEIKTIDSYARRGRSDVLCCNIINYYFFFHLSRTIRVRRSNVNLYNYRYLYILQYYYYYNIYSSAARVYQRVRLHDRSRNMVGIHETTCITILHVMRIITNDRCIGRRVLAHARRISEPGKTIIILNSKNKTQVFKYF